MNNARRLRRKTAKALKIVSELDDTDHEVSSDEVHPSESRLQEAGQERRFCRITSKNAHWAVPGRG
jgi:hypothetical protein